MNRLINSTNYSGLFWPIVFVLFYYYYYSGQISVTDLKKTARFLKSKLIWLCCIYLRLPWLSFLASGFVISGLKKRKRRFQMEPYISLIKQQKSSKFGSDVLRVLFFKKSPRRPTSTSYRFRDIKHQTWQEGGCSQKNSHFTFLIFESLQAD